MTKYHRTREPDGLLVFEEGGEHFTVRQDREIPGLFHWKLTWPSGRRYWRPISPEAWARFPKAARDRILDHFGMTRKLHP